MMSGTEIALAIPRGGRHEDFIAGVLAYVAEKNLVWRFVSTPDASLSICDLGSWRGAGAIAAIGSAEETLCAREFARPLVVIAGDATDLSAPACVVDDGAIGRMAADHLVTRGFQSLAFFGVQDDPASARRLAGFQEALTASGHACDTYLEPAPRQAAGAEHSAWLQTNQQLAEWLAGRATPLGVFAVSDRQARVVLDASRVAGLKTPQDVAIVGVDNDELACAHGQPTLSSIACNDRQHGRQAARMLHGQLLGEDVPRYTATPPLEVVERESTHTFAVRDARLRIAVEFLHQEMHRADFSIDAMARHANVSRRWLEYEFRKSLSETPYQYLRRQRLTRARWLLTGQPEQTIQRIAEVTGFTSAKQFATTFKQDLGISPREYRRTARG